MNWQLIDYRKKAEIMNFQTDLKVFFVFGICLCLNMNSQFAQAASSIENIGEIRDGVRHLSASEAAAILKLDTSIRVLDVRTGIEHRFGHIEGSTNINYYSFSFKEQLNKLDKNLTWLVHCKVGVRSGKTIPLMKESGFVSIIHMDGGIDDWKNAGLPITR